MRCARAASPIRCCCATTAACCNDATVWRLDRDRFWVFTGRRCRPRRHRRVRCAIRRRDRRALPDARGHRGPGRCQPAHDRAVLAGRRACRIALLWLSASHVRRYRMLDCAARLQRRNRLRDRRRRRGSGIALAARCSPRVSDAGLVECGFDAADSLRIEAGHILFTRELASPVTPVRARARPARRSRSRGNSGVDRALRERRRQPARRRLAGLLPAGDADPDADVPPCLAEGTGGHDERLLVPALRTASRPWLRERARCPPRHRRSRLSTGGRARVARLPFYDPAEGAAAPRVLTADSTRRQRGVSYFEPTSNARGAVLP